MRRVEHAIESGWPDVHYCHQGQTGWIELKAELKFPSTIKYEPAQPIWLTNYWKAGGTCYTFLKVVEENKLYVWAGSFANDLNKPDGANLCKPMLVITMNEKGWLELYDMFNSEQNVLPFPQQTP